MNLEELGRDYATAKNAERELKELRKVVWPTKEQLGTYTVVVIVFVTLLAILVSGLDLAFAKLVLLVFG